MKPHVFVLTFVTVLLLPLAAIAAACGGSGEELSLEEYFRLIDNVGNDAGAAFDKRSIEPPAQDANEREIADYAHASLARSVTILGEARDSIDEIEPPPEVEQPHDQFLEALTTTINAVEKVADELPDTLSAAELGTLNQKLDTPEVNEATGQLGEACKRLQAVADAKQIDTKLEC